MISLTRESILANPADYVVIVDSQACFPVTRSDAERSNKSEDDIWRMDEDEYAYWRIECDTFPLDTFGGVGSQQMNDLCAELIAAGAERWAIIN